MPIDTDDLSDKTYRAIIREADKFHDDLSLQFGLLSYKCKDENDFIRKSEKLINKMMKYKEVDLRDIFFEDVPDEEKFRKVLYKMLNNISKLNNK
jgi:hypothetical protein